LLLPEIQEIVYEELQNHFTEGEMMVLPLLLMMLVSYGPFVSLGPEGGEIKAVIQSPLDADILYGMSGYNPTVVVRSTDRGLSWDELSSFTGSTPYDMVITQNGTLVALGSSMVWRSADGGLTWASASFSNTVFWLAAVHPTSGSTVFATGYKYDGSFWRNTFFKSTDGGASWTSTYCGEAGLHSFGRSIAVAPSNPNFILVGGYKSTTTTDAQLFSSTDGGATFSDITPAGSSVDYYFEGLAFHPTNPSIILAGAYLALYRSTDGGSTWARITQYYNNGLAFSSVDNNLALGAGLSATYQSTNAGVSWNTVTSGLSGTNCKWIVPDREDASLAYTGTTAGFFRSTTGGTSWTASNTGLVIGNVISMARCNGYLWANMASQGLYRMQDGSAVNWQFMSRPSTCGDFVRLVSNDSNVILGLEGSG
jgi:photosystem II stability/assembly factor-like uncharacterized protein